MGRSRWPLQVRRLRCENVGHSWNALRPPTHAAHGLVHRLLDVRCTDERHLRSQPAAAARDRLVPNSVGAAAPAALGACPTRQGPPDGHGGGGRDVLRWRGTRTARRSPEGKKILVGVAVERRGPKGFGRCRMAILADGSADSLYPFVTANVEPGATVVTDGCSGYQGIDTLGYVHEPHSQRAASAAGELLPGVHRVASLAKRWYLGTHQGRFDDAHLQSYLDEFSFRFNRRRSRSRGLVFHRVLELAVDHDPVRYHQLVANPRPKPAPPTPPADGGHPPSLDRPRANRPWRAA